MSTKTLKTNQNELYDSKQLYIRISHNINLSLQNVLNKIKNNNPPLGTLKNVNNGLRSGIDRTKNNTNYNVRGVFVLHLDEIKEIYKGSKKESIIKKYYKNSDIKKYSVCNSTDNYIIYSNPLTDFKKYPITFNHLKRHKDYIENKRWEEPIPFYSLVRPRNEEIFMGDKIVCPQRSKINTFGYNNSEWFAGSDCFFITNSSKAKIQISNKYILGILNSKLIYFWLFHRGKRKGDMLELIATPVSEIPIKLPTDDVETSLIKVVDQILAAKQKDPNADTSALEKQIDEMVYALYGLTPEEIAIVEGKR